MGFGSSLALGMVGANAFFDQNRRLEQYDYGKAKRDAELSTLPERTEADRSGYQLQNARNSASLSTLPQETANRTARLGLESTDLAGQAARQPDEIAAKNTWAAIDRSNASNEQANLPTTQEIGNNRLAAGLLQSRADLDMLPDKLESAFMQGAITKQGQYDVTLGTFAGLLSAQDKDGALRFANSAINRTNIFQTLKGKSITDVAPVVGGKNGNGYALTTSDGQSIFIPVDALKSAMGKIKNGEYQFIHDTHGNVWAGNKATGAVTQTHKGDTTLAGRQNTPAEIQMIEYLVNNKMAKDRNTAWEMVRSARQDGREAFMQKYILKNPMMESDPDKLRQQAEAAYNGIRGGGPAQAGAPAAGSNDWQSWTQ